MTRAEIGADRVRRHGEAEARYGLARLGQTEGADDADEAAARVEHGAAGIARLHVDAQFDRVGETEAVVFEAALELGHQHAPERHHPALVVGRADGEHRVGGLERVRIREFRHGHAGERRDLHQRQFAVAIDPEDSRLARLAVERHHHRVVPGVERDVRRRDDKAARVHDHAARAVDDAVLAFGFIEARGPAFRLADDDANIACRRARGRGLVALEAQAALGRGGVIAQRDRPRARLARARRAGGAKQGRAQQGRNHPGPSGAARRHAKPSAALSGAKCASYAFHRPTEEA